MHTHLSGAMLCMLLLVACTQTPVAPADTSQQPLRAHGNEPFWSLQLEHGRLQWQTPGRQLTGQVQPQASGSGVRLVGQLDGQPIEVRTQGRICRDSMSGMPHPHEVLVLFQGRRYPGCGGEPLALLQGAWQVTAIEGGLPADAQLTLQFSPDGGLAGRAGCNRYSSRYALSGEGLRIGTGMSTRMACPPGLMDVERRYLRQLEAVQRFDLGADGSLQLIGPQGQPILARRP